MSPPTRRPRRRTYGPRPLIVLASMFACAPVQAQAQEPSSELWELSLEELMELEVAGMDDYISKPIDTTKLFETLGQWIGEDVQTEPRRTDDMGPRSEAAL